MQSSSTSAIIRVHLSFSHEHTLTIKNHNRPALMLDERSPCGNFPFRTVCCESITPYFESVTIPRAFTLATIAFRSMVWCSK